MNNLFISLFNQPNADRKIEYHTCLLNNIQIFDNIYVLSETGADVMHHVKVVNLPVSCRPTFRTFFKAINHITKDNDTNVIANADIYFDNIVQPNKNQCFALTRWDGDVFMNRADSQDSWIFNGCVAVPKYCDFSIGVPGCDNRISWELKMAGYEVINPSLSVITRHVHKHPTVHSQLKRVQQPYFKPQPCNL